MVAGCTDRHSLPGQIVYLPTRLVSGWLAGCMYWYGMAAALGYVPNIQYTDTALNGFLIKAHDFTLLFQISDTHTECQAKILGSGPTGYM